MHEYLYIGQAELTGTVIAKVVVGVLAMAGAPVRMGWCELFDGIKGAISQLTFVNEHFGRESILMHCQ